MMLIHPNASDLEMFAFMSYEGYKGRTAPNSINNYSAYKTMKADAGYGMASTDENSFVNKKVNADYLLEQIYDSLKKRETEQEAKSFDVCEYLLPDDKKSLKETAFSAEA